MFLIVFLDAPKRIDNTGEARAHLPLSFLWHDVQRPRWRSLIAKYNLSHLTESTVLGCDRLIRIFCLHPGLVVGLWKVSPDRTCHVCSRRAWGQGLSPLDVQRPPTDLTFPAAWPSRLRGRSAVLPSPVTNQPFPPGALVNFTPLTSWDFPLPPPAGPHSILLLSRPSSARASPVRLTWGPQTRLAWSHVRMAAPKLTVGIALTSVHGGQAEPRSPRQPPSLVPLWPSGRLSRSLPLYKVTGGQAALGSLWALELVHLGWPGGCQDSG